MTLIYAVEDDEGIGELYSYALENAGYDFAVFGSGAEFFDALKIRKPDLLLLDVMLPDVSGYSILKRLRAEGCSFPVVMVTAKGDEISTVKGLDYGADDYIVKPFSVLELMARIKARLRGYNEPKKSLLCGDLVIDEQRHAVFCKGTELKLSVKEYEILKLLVSQPERVFSRDEILNIIWGVDFIGESRALDMHIKNLRDKLEKAGERDVIATVRGVGYKFALRTGGEHA